MKRPTARSAGALVAWLAAVAAATIAGMLAVGAIGNGIVSGGDRPLSEAEVSRELAQPVITTVPTSVPSTPAVPPADEPTVLGSPGGTVVARCSPDAKILSTSPAQGYQVKDVEPEDGGMRVRFEAGDTRVELQVTCVNGTPTASVRTQ